MILEYNLQFFAKEGAGGEKTEAATPKKLDKAREEGQVAKSQDLNTAVLLFVLFGCLKIFGGFVADQLIKCYTFFYGLIGDVAREEMNPFSVFANLGIWRAGGVYSQPGSGQMEGNSQTFET